jgi:scyllo-inositol 2-dehydrogenase (NADP+)
MTAAVSVALVGYGFVGKVFHAPLLRCTPGLKLAAVVSSRPVDVQADLGNVRVVPQFDAVLDDADIELVVIGTPNGLHHPQAKAALLAGKHVVVDKPFTVTVAEAEDLIATAAQVGRLLVPFHNRRWDGDFLTLKALITGGALGAVHEFRARFDRFRPELRNRWRESAEPGGGLLYDLGPHLIDQAITLFGPPQSVLADVRKQRPGARADDSFLLVLDHGAVRSVLSAGVLYTAPTPHFAVYGDSGSYEILGLDPQEDQMKAGLLPNAPGFGAQPPEHWGQFAGTDGVFTPHPTQPGHYVGFYEAMVRAIRDGAPPPVAAADAVAGLRVIEQAANLSH